jgi:hypothetical protein
MAEKRHHPDSPDVDTGHATGPTSEQGLEASELDRIVPEGERGSVDTDPRRIAARKLPTHTGGTTGGDVGMRAMPNSADADDHGGRKHN